MEHMTIDLVACAEISKCSLNPSSLSAKFEPQCSCLLPCLDNMIIILLIQCMWCKVFCAAARHWMDLGCSYSVGWCASSDFCQSADSEHWLLKASMDQTGQLSWSIGTIHSSLFAKEHSDQWVKKGKMLGLQNQEFAHLQMFAKPKLLQVAFLFWSL